MDHASLEPISFEKPGLNGDRTGDAALSRSQALPGNAIREALPPVSDAEPRNEVDAPAFFIPQLAAPLFRSFRLRHWVFSFFLVFAGFLLFSLPAHAHRVNVFAWVEGDTVHVESKFSGGKPVHQGKVIVTGPAGAVVLEGTTNDQGEFTFTAPRKADLTVNLEAGTGHRGEWTVRADEIDLPEGDSGGDAMAAPSPADSSAESVPVEPAAVSGEARTQTPAKAVSLEQVEQAVDQALDRKLKPVMRLLTESRQAGPGVTEIVGGIGYIFGLMGVAAWFQSRRKRDQ
jgi:nickel transport protein